MMKTYRKGAVGALMDEYERAVNEYRSLVQNTTEEEFNRIADSETADDDCRSIQTITAHIIGSGYAYANYIREQFSTPVEPFQRRLFSHGEVGNEIDKMLNYTIRTLDGKWEMPEGEISRIVINSRWGVVYDLEQMLEHAIVHILRHRRQIDKFLLKFET